MKQRVFLHKISLSPMHKGSTSGRCRDPQLICSIGQTQKKNKTRRTKKGSQIEIAGSSEWLAKRVQGLGQMAPKPKSWFVRKKVFWANIHATAGPLNEILIKTQSSMQGVDGKGVSPANSMTTPQIVHVSSQTAPFPKPIRHTSNRGTSFGG